MRILKQPEPPKRILYVQYTNPAGYPPLEHSSRILAGLGWLVLFLGTDTLGSHALRFPSHPNICVRQMPFQSAGWRQKLHYLRYCAWVLGWALRFRPQWIYVSDPLACPAALLLSRLPGVRVIYHEHDSPNDKRSAGSFQHLVLQARLRLAHQADLCVLPNEQRTTAFNTTLAPPRPAVTVWNCPRIDEVAPPQTGHHDRALHVLYHGSIVPSRLPETVLTALAMLPDYVQLRVIGYETVGSQGYVRALQAQASMLGVAGRIEFLAAVPRSELVRHSRDFYVGLTLMPHVSDDANLSAMVGASNKTFDYLASGLALLVTNLPAWQAAYIEPGYGLACDPTEPTSIAAALRWLLNNPAERHAMGERGRQRILAEWNYERQFEPVLAHLER